MYLPDLTLHTLSIRKRHKQQKSAFACLAWMHTCSCYVQSAQPQPFTAIMTRYVWLAAPRHCPMQPRGERERASVDGTSLEVALTVSFLSQSCSLLFDLAMRETPPTPLPDSSFQPSLLVNNVYGGVAVSWWQFLSKPGFLAGLAMAQSWLLNLRHS